MALALPVLPVEAEEHCERILRAVISKPTGEEQDIEDDVDANIIFEEQSSDPEISGWIQLEWENKSRYENI